MAFSEIYCDWCSGNPTDGPSLEWKYPITRCDSCHNTKEELSWHFCNLSCLKKALASGLQCKWCWGSGYLSGFRSNGDCERCIGRGYFEPGPDAKRQPCNEDS